MKELKLEELVQSDALLKSIWDAYHKNSKSPTLVFDMMEAMIIAQHKVIENYEDSERKRQIAFEFLEFDK